MLYKCNVGITVHHVGPTTIFRSHFIRFHIPTTWGEYTLVILVSAHNSLNNSLTPLDTSAVLHRYNRYNKYNSYNNRNSLHRSPYNSLHNSLCNSLHNSLQLNSPVHNSPLRQTRHVLSNSQVDLFCFACLGIFLHTCGHIFLYYSGSLICWMFGGCCCWSDNTLIFLV